MAEGLAFLHLHEIVHRDICDGNILLDLKSEVPKVKIADFGMSRLIPQDQMSTTLTALGHRQFYLPPEASEYPVDYSYSLDLYALGVLGLQLVQVQTHIKHKAELLSLLEQISDNHVLKAIILSCLSEKAETRPQAKDVAKMINNLC